MDLIDYYITKDCIHQPNYNISLIPKGFRERVLKRSISNICVHFIYSLVDNTIIDYILNWDNFHYKEFNALFLQILYIIYILDSNGYHHNDLHGFNIGITHTKEKYINILNKKIPTYGNYIQLIDFDKVIHKKYYKNYPNLEENYRYSTDFSSLLISLIVVASYFPLLKNIKI